MSKIKVIIPAYNEEKAIAHVIKEIPNSVSEIIITTTQLIILLKWQQQLVPPYFQKGRVWLCLLKRNGTFRTKIKPDIVVF
jgi:glycosyltransferase involved in cell wall biosynthesis